MENINNLDNFNVRKLNTDEATKIDGGVPWGPIITIGLAVEENWEEIKKGFNEEWNSGS